MKEIILVKNGELVLKGLNRNTFEDVLIKNMRRHLADLGEFKFTKSQSTIMVEAPDGVDLDEVAERLDKVFGIAAYSRAAVCEKDMQGIVKTAREYLADELSLVSTFKVEAKRSDKKFPLKSPEICRELGGALLKTFTHLKVDVHNPDVTVTVEIRDHYAFVRGNNIKGAGGMPTGTSGRAAVLISGGIDSPVAAYMMAKRGIELVAVHFASPPYTSELAEMKVMDLLKKVSAYCGTITTYVVPFTEIQEAIRDSCPEEYFTLVMRRIMMKISNIIAENQNCRALITGRAWVRLPARPSMPSSVRTVWQNSRCSARASVWIRMRSLRSPEKSIPLIRPYSRMRTAARCLRQNTRAPARNRRMWKRRKVI